MCSVNLIFVPLFNDVTSSQPVLPPATLDKVKEPKSKRMQTCWNKQKKYSLIGDEGRNGFSWRDIYRLYCHFVWHSFLGVDVGPLWVYCRYSMTYCNLTDVFIPNKWTLVSICRWLQQHSNVKKTSGVLKGGDSRRSHFSNSKNCAPADTSQITQLIVWLSHTPKCVSVSRSPCLVEVAAPVNCDGKSKKTP